MTEQRDEIAVLLRQLVWDITPHCQVPDPDVQRHFGLVPASADVLRMEHNESDRRLLAIYHLNSRITLLSGLAGTIAARGNLDFLDEDVSLEESSELLGSVITYCSAAIIADLVDKGLLSYNTAKGYSHG